MNKFKIGLDIDGVIANFALGWHNIYPDVSATPNTWNFDSKMKERFKTMRENRTLNDFYLNLMPMIKPEDLLFEPHCYITSRPIPKEITEQWLDKHNFPRKTVISLELGQSKIEATREAGVEIFIDDFYGNFIELNNAGISTYLFSQPWNVEYNVGDMRLNSLNDILLLKE